MFRKTLWERLLLGAAAGFAGTMALQGLRAASRRWLPQTTSPIRRDPGDFMVEKAEKLLPETVRWKVTEKVELAASQALGIGYGMAFGALYGVSRLEPRSSWWHGSSLGLVTWAAGYLGWLPASGLMRPIWRQRPAQVVTPALQHVAYGAATVAAYEWLDRRVGS